MVATTELVESLLSQSLGTIVIPATKEDFITQDRFVVDTGRKAPVKISHLGKNFQKRFLKKIEGPAVKTKLHYVTLLKPSLDGPIISELGGEEKSETTLANIYALMRRQRNGEKNGVLPINSYAKIFYVRDINDELGVVFLRWLGLGWNVHARSVDYPIAWLVGRHVFFRIRNS